MAKRVVLIEDDETLVEILKINLEQAGLEVLTAYEGVEGLALIREKLPDAVVLDIMMPHMNGYEICVALQDDETTRAIPIIVITAVTEEDGPRMDEVWRERLGVADFISKPFDPADLTQRVLATVAAD